jgi:hypothetical protein
VHRTRIIRYAHRNPLRIFTLHPCWAIYFLPTAAKSKQKMPRSGQVLKSALLNQIKAAMICSLQALLKLRPCNLSHI